MASERVRTRRRLMRWVCWRHMRLRPRWHLDVLCIGGAGRVGMRLVLVEVIVVDAISVRIITVHRCPASADGFFLSRSPSESLVATQLNREAPFGRISQPLGTQGQRHTRVLVFPIF